MRIEHIKEDGGGYFKAVDQGRDVGVMSYSNEGEGVITIDHTAVDAHYSGKGVGKGMVVETIEFARKNELDVIPLCSFARSVIMRDKALQDVVIMPVW